MQNAQSTENASENKNSILQSISDSAIILTPEEIERYLTLKESEGCVAGTISAYRRAMQLFYQVLPEDKSISIGPLLLCKEHFNSKRVRAAHSEFLCFGCE